MSLPGSQPAALCASGGAAAGATEPSDFLLHALALVVSSGFLVLGGIERACRGTSTGASSRESRPAAPGTGGVSSLLALCRATWTSGRLLAAEQRLWERRSVGDDDALPAQSWADAHEADLFARMHLLVRRVGAGVASQPILRPLLRPRLAFSASVGDARRLAALALAYGSRATAREVSRVLRRSSSEPFRYTFGWELDDDCDRETPLALACRGQHAGAVAFLLAAGAPATASACIAAVLTRDCDIVARLLDAPTADELLPTLPARVASHGARPPAALQRAADAWPAALAKAVARGADDVVRLILARKAVPQSAIDGALCVPRVPLELCFHDDRRWDERHVETARALLDAGAPVDGPPHAPRSTVGGGGGGDGGSVDDGGDDDAPFLPPLLRAIVDRVGEVAHLLLARGARADAVYRAPGLWRTLSLRTDHDDVGRRRGGGRRHAPHDGERADDGATPLHAAVVAGEFGLAEALLARGARAGYVAGASVDLAGSTAQLVRGDGGDARAWRFVAQLVAPGGLLPRADAVCVLERCLGSLVVGRFSQDAAQASALAAMARGLCFRDKAAAGAGSAADTVAAERLFAAACRVRQAATVAALLPLVGDSVLHVAVATLHGLLPASRIGEFAIASSALIAGDADVASLVRAMHARGIATDADAAAVAAIAAVLAAHDEGDERGVHDGIRRLGGDAHGGDGDGDDMGDAGEDYEAGVAGADGDGDSFIASAGSPAGRRASPAPALASFLLSAVGLEMPETVAALLGAGRVGAPPGSDELRRALRDAVRFIDSTPGYDGDEGLYFPADGSTGRAYADAAARFDWGGGAAAACTLLAAGARADDAVLFEAARRGYTDVVRAILASGLVPRAGRCWLCWPAPSGCGCGGCDARLRHPALGARVAGAGAGDVDASTALSRALAAAVCSTARRGCSPEYEAPHTDRLAPQLDADLGAVVAQLLTAGAWARLSGDGVLELLVKAAELDARFDASSTARGCENAAAAAGVPADAVVRALFGRRLAVARALLAGGCSASAAAAVPQCCEAALVADADDVFSALLAAAAAGASGRGADLFARRRRAPEDSGAVAAPGWQTAISRAAGAEAAEAGGWWRLALHRCARPEQISGGIGAPRCAAVLLRAGAPVDAVDGAGWAPLHIAALLGAGAVVAVLLAAGADGNRRLAPGTNAALQAAHAAAARASAAVAMHAVPQRFPERVAGGAKARAHAAALRALRAVDATDAATALARDAAAARAARADSRIRTPRHALRALSAPAAARLDRRDDADVYAAASAVGLWAAPAVTRSRSPTAADTARVLFSCSSGATSPLSPALAGAIASVWAAVEKLPKPQPLPAPSQRPRRPRSLAHAPRGAACPAAREALHGHACFAAEALADGRKREDGRPPTAADIVLEHLARTGATPLLLAAAPFGSRFALGKADAVAALVAANADAAAALLSPVSPASLLEERLAGGKFPVPAHNRTSIVAGLVAELPPGATPLRLAQRASALGAGDAAVRALTGGGAGGTDGAASASTHPPSAETSARSAALLREAARSAAAAAGASADWIEQQLGRSDWRGDEAPTPMWPDALTPVCS